MRRSKREMCIDVLRAIDEGKSILTLIMYAANISWRPLHAEILSHLIRKGLITESVMDGKYSKKTKSVYYITAKGRAVIVAQDEVARNLRL